MYEGSMVGAGSHVFAVMGYVIAKQVPDKKVGAQVELNPKLLAFVLGDTEERIQDAIDFLCAPDEKSRSKVAEGRRLIRLGQFDYQVVNGAKYRSMRDEEQRREQNREAQRRLRARRGKPLPGEAAAVRAEENGASHEQMDRMSDAALPEKAVVASALGALADE